MDLFKAHEQGLPLVIETGEGGDRLAAEIFKLDQGGVVFADIGWPEASWHPFHVIEGEVRETGDGWVIGDTPVRVAFEGEQLEADWQVWHAWRASESGKKFNRDACWANMSSAGSLAFAAAT